MPERSQNLIRTRCPECVTIFRVTSAQLRQKAGTVRCGHCQALFNAFDHLVRQGQHEAVDEHPLPLSPLHALSQETSLAAPGDAQLAAPAESVLMAAVEPEDAGATLAPLEFAPEQEVAVEQLPPDVAETAEAVIEPVSVITESPALLAEEGASPPFSADSGIDHSVSEQVVASEPEEHRELELPQQPEDATELARAAGLVAARELVDTASYNRWSEGVLAGNSLDHSLEASGGKAGARWPFILAAILLSLLLLVQAAYVYRTSLVIVVPVLGDVFAALGIEVPLARQVEQVAIETSDLQSDPGRGLLILNATLKNRAAFSQAWPSLELTLTDVNDAVVSRRVIESTEYLPASEAGNAFVANGEQAIRLWIEAKSIAASGYRLYLFYH